MVALLIAVLMVLCPLLHLAISRLPRDPLRVIHILLLYALVFGVGMIGLPLGFIPHVFFPDESARLIGWQPGSPFQFEVGTHDGAWGILGFLCIRIRGLFWLATGLGWSLFMLGATYGHVREAVVEGNYAPYNFLTIFSDGFIALWLLGLLYLQYLFYGDEMIARADRGKWHAYADDQEYSAIVVSYVDLDIPPTLPIIKIG